MALVQENINLKPADRVRFLRIFDTWNSVERPWTSSEVL